MKGLFISLSSLRILKTLLCFFRKKSIKLGTNWHGGVPIEVLPISYRLVKEKIESLYCGEAVLRQAKCKAVIIQITLFLFYFYQTFKIGTSCN